MTQNTIDIDNVDTWPDTTQTLRNMERVRELRTLLRTLEERNSEPSKKAHLGGATVLEDAAYILLVKKEIERIERQTLYAEMNDCV